MIYTYSFECQRMKRTYLLVLMPPHEAFMSIDFNDTIRSVMHLAVSMASHEACVPIGFKDITWSICTTGIWAGKKFIVSFVFGILARKKFIVSFVFGILARKKFIVSFVFGILARKKFIVSFVFGILARKKFIVSFVSGYILINFLHVSKPVVLLFVIDRHAIMQIKRKRNGFCKETTEISTKD